MILIKPAKPKKERRVPSQLNTKIQKREKYPILIKKEEVIPILDLGTRNEFKVWNETIANSKNVELLHSPEESCGGNRKFGNKMATSTVEKNASGRGERNIKIKAMEITVTQTESSFNLKTFLDHQLEKQM